MIRIQIPASAATAIAENFQTVIRHQARAIKSNAANSTPDGVLITKWASRIIALTTQTQFLAAAFHRDRDDLVTVTVPERAMDDMLTALDHLGARDMGEHADLVSAAREQVAAAMPDKPFIGH